MAGGKRTTRRKFLRQAGVGAAALGAPYFVPGRALGLQGATPASDRIVMGVIGTGGMGKANLGAFMDDPEVQMIAVCDVDAGHLKEGADAVNGKYGSADCRTFADFRELLAVKEIEAVAVVTPDHWHALASIAAAKAGKDIYCEKPLANSIGEGRAMCEAVKQHRRILQCGSHERSNPKVRQACEYVRSGRLGKIHTLRVNLPTDEQHHQAARAITTMPPEAPAPPGFDYDFWLGHAPAVPYHEKQCHFFWRFNLSYGGGEMTDRGAHIIDIGQLGLDMDATGPVKYEATGVQTTGLYNTFFDFDFENVYANGVKMIGTSKHGPRGIGFEGEKGKLFVNIHGGEFSAEPASLIADPIGDDEVQLGRTPSHRRNFLDCVRSREEPFATAEIAQRTATICHLNNIAMQIKRGFTWDPVAERTDDDEANAMLTASMRSPWTL
jgi:predicted dehydrogenase